MDAEVAPLHLTPSMHVPVLIDILPGDLCELIDEHGAAARLQRAWRVYKQATQMKYIMKYAAKGHGRGSRHVHYIVWDGPVLVWDGSVPEVD